MRRFVQVPTIYILAEYEKYQNYLSENFQFLEVKVFIYLNRRVFVILNLIICLVLPRSFDELKTISFITNAD